MLIHIDYSHVYNYPGGSKTATTLLSSQLPHGPSHPTLSMLTPPIQPSATQTARPSQQVSAVSSPGSTSATPSDKRKFTEGVEETLEEAARDAAEEDKRRRNTAASARFRVKKKQREAALEKSAKDMSDRVSYLENRVQQLEMENKLLKNLITEKSGKDGELAELARNIGAGKGEEVEKFMKKKGVGTVKEGVKAEA